MFILIEAFKSNLVSVTNVIGNIIFFLRVTSINCDVWVNLSTNWDHFFWLTGEFPHTLQIIVDKIQTKFFIKNQRGPKVLLSVRNQVHRFIVNVNLSTLVYISVKMLTI